MQKDQVKKKKKDKIPLLYIRLSLSRGHHPNNDLWKVKAENIVKKNNNIVFFFTNNVFKLKFLMI